MAAAREASAAKNRRVLNVLELVLELEPALRGAYLETIGRGDSELKQQVLAILRALGGQAEADGDATKAEARLSSLEMPERVGPYQIVREIGRGGMSRVYLAERADEEFERQVALKVIDQGLEAPIVHQRFLAERQILASFDCPQIAKLFDGGTLPNGRPYLVMELVDGVRADQFCAEQQLSLRERIVLFRKICGAVSYAHQKLVVHRDLKPSNILVTADQEPKLLDFGIAKLLDPASFPFELNEATRSHHRPMTPSYASPEQLLGEPISTATDVYALGVLLFQLLTGEVPHPQQDRLQLVLRERAGELKAPKPSESLGPSAERSWEGGDLRRLSRQLRGDLDNIVAKALRPHAEERYASVVELDEDLRRYLEGEPVRATRETPLYLLGKFLRRYRWPVAVAAIVLALVSTFAVVTQRQAQRIAQERDRANEIRGFLANLIGSADTQSRRSGSVSLKELLDENFERLKNEPFRDPQTQFELLELIGDGYHTLELDNRAVDVFQLALRVPRLEKSSRRRVVWALLWSSGESGRLGEIGEVSEEAMETGLGERSEDRILASLPLGEAQLTSGQLVSSAHSLRQAFLASVEQNQSLSNELMVQELQLRLALLSISAEGDSRVLEGGVDLWAVLRQSQQQNVEALRRIGLALQFIGDHEEALLSHRFLLSRLGDGHEYGIVPAQIFESYSEALLRNGFLEEASRANSLSRRSASTLLGLDPQSLRAQYQLAQIQTREGEILQAKGRQAEAAVSLHEAIAILEPMARDTSIIYVKSTLARAYLLSGRLDEARALVKILLDMGWRRGDLMRLAAEKGVLPDPMPPPLELDLSLPPRLRAYIDSLPHEPPPWQTATDLPTIEEILAAEEARVGIETKSP